MAASQAPPDDGEDEPPEHPRVPDACPEIEAECISLPSDEQHNYVIASNLNGEHVYSDAALDPEVFQ